MKNDSLINYLLRFDSLNTQQIEMIQSSLEERAYEEGEFFLKAGQVSREIGFITDGVFRVFYYDNEGSEITRYFIVENHFMADINSYNTGISTSEYIESVTNAEILVFSKEAMENLSSTIIKWDDIINKITAKALSEKVNRVSHMMPQDATKRYKSFLKKFPNLANRVPLQYIASYIGVTKSSLSRIRRNMS